MQFTFILLLLFYVKSTDAVENNALKKTMPGFFYTMPRILVAGKNETVCLSTHFSNVPVKVKVTVDLKTKGKHFTSATQMIESEHACFNLHVPQSKNDMQFVSVRVQVEINSIVYSGHNLDPIVIYPQKETIFIETDRKTYKSENTVKFRILALDENILPMQNYRIPIVRICNPLGVTAMIWENVSTQLGMAQLEYELPLDSLLGKWKIEAADESKYFDVMKYILPRFEVSVVHPKVIYYKSSSVTLKVCAKYSYGGIVKGTAFVRLSNPQRFVKNIETLRQMTNGCAEFIFLSENLLWNDLRNKIPITESRVNIIITATVTEYGTDKIEMTTSRAFIVFKPYNMKFVKDDIFLPGLPYQGALQIINVNSDIDSEIIEICYNIAVKKSWNYLNNEKCSNFTIPNDKLILFSILPLRNNVVHLQLNARSLNHSDIIDSLLVVRVFSPSWNYIMLDRIPLIQKAKCLSTQQFSIQYTADNFREHQNVTFFYMTETRGKIQKMKKVIHSVHKMYPNYTNEYKSILDTNHSHKYTKSSSSIGRFILKIKLDENIISNYKLLIYYVTPEGEIISATKEVEVEPCLANKVKANWSHKQIIPGGVASLLLETKSDSLCFVSAIDKAVTFMDGTSSVLNSNAILKPFLQDKKFPESGRKSCVTPAKTNRRGSSKTKEKLTDLNREKRYIYPFSEDYDVYDIFNKFGIITITNFKVVTKPCYTGPLIPSETPVEFLTDQYSTPNEDGFAPIRSFFPETWLWEIIPVRGAAVVHRNLPHTVTTWVTNVLCASASDGVGFSKTTEITTFQPFFVDVLSPYSIKKGETLYLQIIIFNYLTYNIPIRVTVKTTSGLILIDEFNRKSSSFCISSNDTMTHVFEMKAVQVEKVNITVIAELDPTYPRQCGPDILINKRDVVFKTLYIEPDGYPVQITKSALLCGTEKEELNNVTWKLNIPNYVESETAKAEIVFNCDILGPALKNFDNLIVMPTGCGEQIMANIAPSLYILKYLNATKGLTPAIRHKIIRNLKIGYQRILNYLHKDGSFSAFGYYDPSGSMFLTAFVVRVLQEVKQYIYVDRKVIERAVSWILSHQLENGCFNTMLHVFQDMGGTSVENSTVGLTAYVMISLLEGNVEVPESVKTNAKYCIRGHYDLDKYTLAISSYALLKISWYSEANRMITKLLQMSNKKDNMLWWTSKETNGSLASDIEVTSYVLLSLLHQKTEATLANAHSIVRWLSTQQEPNGGFKSTQDTVVALNALTKYSHLTSYKEMNLSINLNTDYQNYLIKFNNNDRLRSKEILLEANNNIKVNVKGNGCVLVQAVLSYYVKQVSNSEAFKLDTEILPVSNIDPCSIARFSSCLTYNGPDPQSNMAILEVDLPSGYEADKATLYKIIHEDKSANVKKFEETREKVVLYLTKVTSQPICLHFNINENAVIYSRSNTTVKLYDYYKPESYILKFYKIRDDCRFKNVSLSYVLKNVTNKEDLKT